MSLPEISRYYFTVAEFERMGEAGVFKKDTRLELIEGEINKKSPISSRHAGCVNFLNRFLNRTMGDTALVSTQNPIQLNDFSEPEPDLALLRLRDDFYRDDLAGGTYQTVSNFRRGEEAHAHTVANLSVSVADVLG